VLGLFVVTVGTLSSNLADCSHSGYHPNRAAHVVVVGEFDIFDWFCCVISNHCGVSPRGAAGASATGGKESHVVGIPPALQSS